MSQEFIELFNQHITREGSANLLAWLKASDFFTAPASTKHHLSIEGGLATHSVNVFKRLKKIVEGESDKLFSSQINLETIAICGLLHDICKAEYYTVEMRNVKKDGEWTKEPYYAISEKLPYGHGEKSVYIISGFMRLNRAEAMAINWHMGGFDDRVRSGGGRSLGEAYKQFPLAVLLHLADMQSTYIDENSLING